MTSSLCEPVPYKDTGNTGLEATSTPVSLILTNHICNNPVSKWVHILMFWRSEPQHTHFGRRTLTYESLRKTCLSLCNLTISSAVIDGIQRFALTCYVLPTSTTCVSFLSALRSPATVFPDLHWQRTRERAASTRERPPSAAEGALRAELPFFL